MNYSSPSCRASSILPAALVVGVRLAVPWSFYIEADPVRRRGGLRALRSFDTMVFDTVGLFYKGVPI
jgi:hypothetical protein